MQLDQALQTFIAESTELLGEMEAALLALESGSGDPELVNAVFRAAHTVKGSAGLFGLDHVVAFTHAVESVLDRLRDGRLAIGEDLISLLLGCCDHTGALIDIVAGGDLSASDVMTQQAEPLLARLRAYQDPETTHHAQAQAAPASAVSPRGVWHISLRLDESVLRNGLDPLSFIRYLGTIGDMRGIMTVTDALPPPELADPECCYLGFEIGLETDADQQTIENVFEFLHDDCRLRILPPGTGRDGMRAFLRELSDDPARAGDMLVRCGTLTMQQLAAMQTPAPAADGVPVTAGQPQAAAAPRSARAGESVAEPRSVRIDADKLDHLINQVGELIIAGAAVKSIALAAHLTDLQENVSKLSSLVEDVRDSALQLRMVKIGATLNRFRRAVHDVAQELGKQITLEIEGEDTELDKTVVEKIGDPLMHLIRNAADHGIESADMRGARGKPAAGTIRLAAYHDSGSIVISVSDDGNGLNREKILAKAIERGMVQQGRSLSDSEVFNLIFEPGFSTADSVTNLSGRGVGLDVVKRNITALRGSVDVESREGAGTTFTVRLPLTLAIIDGFLVGVGKSVFAIPLDTIDECVAFSSALNHRYTNLRGEVLPYIRLRDHFGTGGAAARRENIVVVRHAGMKAGLVVDTLLGEFQTVIKPIGRMFSRIRCISGSTILGGGEVALILDVPALVQQVVHASESNMRAAPDAVAYP